MAEDDVVLNVSRLRVLRELAQRGTIAAVADALWLTPSAVSQQLAALERETRVELVERAGRGVRLTAAGRVLAERSERVFEALDEAKAALLALRDEPTGRLRVASFPSVVRLVFPLLLRRVRERFPALELEIEDLEGEQGLDAVRLGHVDLAVIDDLTWTARDRADGLKVVELFATPLVVVFRADHEWAARDEIGWAELDAQPVVTEQRASVFARTVQEECRRAGAQPRVSARVHDAGAMLALVEASDLRAVLPELQLKGQASRVGWRVLTPRVERRLLAVTRAGQSEMPAVQAALDVLAEATVQLR
jgi:DNA-binding transcriptional LysR family regulator